MGSEQSYSAFMPLIRILKISFIGVMDFVSGLTLGSIIDRLFSQLLDVQLKGDPIVSQLASGTQYLKTKACAIEPDFGIVQNPACADVPILDRTHLRIVGLNTLAQLITTLIVGLEIRNLIIPYESFLDPTGGIVFVIALLSQKELWGKSRILLQNIYQMFWWLEQPENTQS